MGIDIIGIFSESFWYMAPILASITMAGTQALKTKFGITGFWIQATSWILSAILSVGSWLLGLINLGEPTWLSIIALCACCGLASCGYYDIPTIKELVKKWFSFIPKA